MSASLDSVIAQIIDLTIVMPNVLKNFVPPNAHPMSPDELLRELCNHHLLTTYQAERIAEGNGTSLILAGYTILDKIGAGGMGQIFKAEHRRMKRVVAIKTLPAVTRKNAAAIARFQREVEAAAKLRHPNIIAADDAEEHDGIHFLVMEYVDGHDLHALVREHGPLSVADAVGYIIQAARGLRFAHEAGVVHRDIKPSNLLLDKKGNVKILDMGLARIDTIDDGTTQDQLTESGVVLGTASYMAPEQFTDAAHADARADIYGLGCTLYFLLAGKPIYVKSTVIERIVAHREEPIPHLRRIHPGVSELLEAVFTKMVAKQTQDRYQTMNDVLVDLEKCRDELVSIGLTQIITSLTSQSTVREKAAVTKKAGGGKLFALSCAAIIGIAVLAAAVAPSLTQEGRNSGDKVPNKVTVASPESKADVPQAKLAFERPGFDEWMKEVASYSAENQVIAVVKKLQELNPDWDGVALGSNGIGTPEIEGGVVIGFGLVTDKVKDISPIRAFSGLTNVSICGTYPVNSSFSDLSPIAGMKLRALHCCNSQITDLSPLKGMPLTRLYCVNTQISELSPIKDLQLIEFLCHGCMQLSDLSSLQGHPMTKLGCYATRVRSLSPLRGMALTYLDCGGTQVSDLSPLEGMPLKELNFWRTAVSTLSQLENMPLVKLSCHSTQISDLTPLKGLPITRLECWGTNVTDLSPLDQMSLESISFTPANITLGIEVVRQMKSLKSIGVDDRMLSPDDFWMKYDAEEFGKLPRK